MERGFILRLLYGNSGARKNMADFVMNMFASYNLDAMLISDFNFNYIDYNFKVMCSDKRTKHETFKWSAIITKNDNSTTQIMSPKPNWTVSIMRKANKHICLIAIYFNVHQTTKDMLCELQELNDYVNKLKYDIIIIGGDFNCDTIGQNMLIPQKKAEILKCWCCRNNFKSTSINSPDYTLIRGKSRLDHLLIKSLTTCQILEENTFGYGNLDHKVTITKIEFKAAFPTVHRIISEMKSNLEITLNIECECTKDIDDAIERIKNDFITSKIISYKIKPKERDTKISNIHRKIMYACKHWSQKPNFEQIIEDLERQKRTIASEDIKNNVNDIKILYRINPWKAINKITNGYFKNVIPLQNHYEKEILNNNKEKCLAEFSDNIKQGINNYSKYKWDKITTKEVNKMLAVQKSNPHICPSGLTLSQNQNLCNALTELVNLCLKFSHFPQEWACGWMTLIPKKNSNKLRCIVTQHPMGIVLQRTIAVELNNKIEDLKETILKQQYGFISKRSIAKLLYEFAIETESNRTYVNGKWTYQGYTIMDMDIEAAFDSINHKILINVLEKFNISQKNIAIIKSFLSNFCVKSLKNGRIVRKYIEQGVPQGSVLGPLLWTLMSAEFLQQIYTEFRERNLFKIFMYADDIKLVIYRNDCSYIIIDTISKILNTLGLTLNKEKTKHYALAGGMRIHHSFKFSERINIFGMVFQYSKKGHHATTLNMKETATAKIQGLNVVGQTLYKVNKQCLELVIRACIMATFNHLWPMLSNYLELSEMWMCFHEIESNALKACLKTGRTPKTLLPFVHTNSLARRHTSSMLFSVCQDFTTYKNHKLFSDNKKLKTMCKNWYNITGNKQAVTTNFIITKSPISNYNNVIIKTKGKSKELWFAFENNQTRGSIKCNNLCSNFDIIRIGIHALLMFIKKTKVSKVQILTKDKSLEKFGPHGLWLTAKQSEPVIICIIDDKNHHKLNEIFENFKPSTIIKSTHMVGKTAVKRTIDEIVERIEADFWNETSSWGTKQSHYKLMRAINESKSPYRMDALRLITGFARLPNNSVCLCKESNLIHYCTTCMDTKLARKNIDICIITYLNQCTLYNRLMPINDLRLILPLTKYLSTLFGIAMSKYYEINNQTHVTSSTTR